MIVGAHGGKGDWRRALPTTIVAQLRSTEDGPTKIVVWLQQVNWSKIERKVETYKLIVRFTAPVPRLADAWGN
jgi:hypothetical protein